MRSYFNGGGTPSSSSATPPPSLSTGAGGAARRSSSYVPGGGRSSSASLPRSPDNDHQPSVALSAHSGSGGGGGQDVYVNIYQNTNHPSLFVSVHILVLFQQPLDLGIGTGKGRSVVFYTQCLYTLCPSDPGGLSIRCRNS